MANCFGCLVNDFLPALMNATEIAERSKSPSGTLPARWPLSVMMRIFPSAIFGRWAPSARSRTLIAAVALGILLAACTGGDVDSPGNEALRNLSTTTTNQPPTTMSLGPGTSTTTSPDIVPANPPNTSVAETTKTQTIALRPDGLGVIAFGVSVDDTVASLTAYLGDPTSVTPATELQFRVDDRWADADDGLGLIWDRPWYQTFCWEQLCTVFGGYTSDGLFFTGWTMSPFNQGRGLEVSEFAPVPDVATGEGITIGSTVGEIAAAYPEIEFLTGEGASALFDIGWTPGGFTGIGTVGPGRLLTVEGIEIVFQLAAGDGPWPGCC